MHSNVNGSLLTLLLIFKVMHFQWTYKDFGRHACPNPSPNPSLSEVLASSVSESIFKSACTYSYRTKTSNRSRVSGFFLFFGMRFEWTFSQWWRIGLHFEWHNDSFLNLVRFKALIVSKLTSSAFWIFLRSNLKIIVI